jgi:O-methyltransferase
MSFALPNIFKKKIPDWQKAIIDNARPYTMVSPENLLAVIQNIQYICKNNIEGDIIECGVWKGGCMMAAAMTLKQLNSTYKKIYLYDTFSIFPEPGPEDISHEGIPGKVMLEKLAPADKQWRAPGMDEVRTNLLRSGYPIENLNFVPGLVEETIPANMPKKVSFLRLDTDWYASTLHELSWLYPRLTFNGVLIIDDYGYWKGSKKAVDEYFEKNKIQPLLKKIDFSARIMYKKQH